MTKKYEVNITQHDLEHIFYYNAADSQKNASNFIIELEKNVYSLQRLTNRNPLISENEYFGTDYRHLIYKSYRIIYRILDKPVFILRIIHGAKLLEL